MRHLYLLYLQVFTKRHNTNNNNKKKKKTRTTRTTTTFKLIDRDARGENVYTIVTQVHSSVVITECD